MMTRILLILLLSTHIINAQPVANNPFIPVAGQAYSTGTLTYISSFINQSMNQKGAGLFWDFSDMPAKYSWTTYTTDKDTLYGSFFPKANYSIKTTGPQGENTYKYYYFGTDSAGYYGYSSIHSQFLIRAPQFDPNVHIRYPVSYNDSFTDYGYFEFIGVDRTTNDSQLSISLYTNTVTVDAWGSMQLKTRTIDSVLKINVSTMHIRHWFSDMGKTVYRNDTVYERYVYFISPQLKGPFLSFSSKIPGNIELSFQNDIFLAAPEVKTTRFSMYPNPASSSITIDLPAGVQATRYSITDLAGRTVSAEALEAATINIEHLSTGIYFLHLYDGGKYIGCEKFCKE